MITLIEAKNYRCLRYVRQPMDAFHILVGPNASGKTTFLDVIAFLGDIVSKGLHDAITERTKNFQDLICGRSGDGFELAVEAAIPEKLRYKLRDANSDTIRYEIALQFDEKSQEIFIRTEKVLLKTASIEPMMKRDVIFPDFIQPPATIITPVRARGTTAIVNKVLNGNDNFYSEVYPEKGKGWAPSFKLGLFRSALANLPADEDSFPVTTWLKNQLSDKVTRLMLNSLLLRKASPPGQGRNFKADDSNLPWVVDHLKNAVGQEQFDRWIAHLKTALPDLENIRVIERPDNILQWSRKHLYNRLWNNKSSHWQPSFSATPGG